MAIPKNSKPAKVRRQSTRFHDESTGPAIINGKIHALVFSESTKGCGLVVLAGSCPKESEEINIDLGALGLFKGIVRWKKQPSDEVAQIGIEYV